MKNMCHCHSSLMDHRSFSFIYVFFSKNTNECYHLVQQESRLGCAKWDNEMLELCYLTNIMSSRRIISSVRSTWRSYTGPEFGFQYSLQAQNRNSGTQRGESFIKDNFLFFFFNRVCPGTWKPFQDGIALEFLSSGYICLMTWQSALQSHSSTMLPLCVDTKLCGSGLKAHGNLRTDQRSGRSYLFPLYSPSMVLQRVKRVHQTK